MLLCLVVPVWIATGSAFAKSVWDGVYASIQAQPGSERRVPDPNGRKSMDADQCHRTSPTSRFVQEDREGTEEFSRTPFGESSFRLADAEKFDAATHAGRKVQVKGVIVRAPAGNRINVNSIEPIAETCR